MERLKNKLNTLYLNPFNGFKMVSILHQKRYFIYPIIAIIILSYPLISAVIDTVEIRNLIQQIEQQQNKLHLVKNRYQDLINKEQELKNKENTLTDINLSIQNIAKKYRLSIHQLEWSLEQEKSIELSIIGSTTPLFHFINELNKSAHIKFHSILLTKLEEDKKIQLNAILVTTIDKE